MNYNHILIIIISFFVFSCDQSFQSNSNKNKFTIEKKYKNIGFTHIKKDNSNEFNKLEQRSLNIIHKSLKKKSIVKITNPQNGNSLIAQVISNKGEFSNFFNSVITLRIAEDLDLNIEEPYIEIILVSKESTFIAKKAKTFEQEKSVAEKAPIDGIQIKDLKTKKKSSVKIDNKKFSYSIKVADFYYHDTASVMIDRIKKETMVKNSSIIKLSETNYRVLIGPFSDIKSLKDSFEKLNSLNFENLQILKNV